MIRYVSFAAGMRAKILNPRRELNISSHTLDVFLKQVRCHKYNDIDVELAASLQQEPVISRSEIWKP